METAEIRRRWLRYFSTRGHTVVPSASLIPPPPASPDGPAPALFVDSGLVPFTPFLIGQERAPFSRATSVQKCVRAADLGQAGRTSRHSTFFQMNGNFSFGDYGPAEAIELAWELITRHQSDGGYGLDESRIWITVLHDDQDSISAWQRLAGVPPERIVRRGPNENYWHAGIPGPGGPRTGIHIDRGADYGRDGGPEADEDRYLQFWSLVFLRDQVSGIRGMGSVDITGPLPVRTIGSGMGLERMACLLQGVDTVIEIDEVYPIIARVEELTGRRYGVHHEDDVLMRVVADHVRSALMLIGDGVTPAAPELDQRGSVVRTLLRGAVASMRDLGTPEPALADLLSVARDRMDVPYPELVARFPDIAQAAAIEERDFPIATETPAGSSPPPIAAEVVRLGPVDFTGFRELSTQTTVRALIDLIAAGALLRSADKGQTVQVVLEHTPFFPETGGQRADEGEITANGARLRVLDVQRPPDPGSAELIVHTAEVLEGTIHSGQEVLASVDREWRLSACQAHSATHVLHAALRQVLGPQVQQVSSRNRPGYLRIDVTGIGADAPLSQVILDEVESVANHALRYDYPVTATYLPLAQARELGALAEPSDPASAASGDVQVRVVEMGGAWSRELCAGTHVEHASQIGAITITGQAPAGPGVWRIEALAGLDALGHLNRARVQLGELGDVLGVGPDQITERVTALAAEVAAARRDRQSQRRAAMLAGAATLAQAPSDVFGVSVVTHDAGPAAEDDVRALVLDVRDRLPADRPGVVAVSLLVEERPLVVVATNDEARHWGVIAGDLIQEARTVLGPEGAGEDVTTSSSGIAQGGGVDPAKLGEALRRIEYSVGERVTSRG